MSDHHPVFDEEELANRIRANLPVNRMIKKLKEPKMNVKDCIFREIIIFGQYHIPDCVAVEENAIIEFKQDKNNLHDIFAIKAYHKGKPAGWVPREISPALVRLLKDGYKVTGVAHRKATRMWATKNDSNFSCDIFAKKCRRK